MFLFKFTVSTYGSALTYKNLQQGLNTKRMLLHTDDHIPISGHHLRKLKKRHKYFIFQMVRIRKQQLKQFTWSL